VKKPAQSDYLRARDEKEVGMLRELSARVGANPLLVQASNGNTSIKLDGALWIKASGRWMARAMEEETHMAVDLAEARECIENGIEIGPRIARESKLKPSIETAMHAVLRHRVVIHVHSINTITWAIRLDGPEQLRERLKGLRWEWIPYAASGIPLARAIEKAVGEEQETDVLVLGNHGLVVCGANCEKAERLLWEVERRLATTVRSFPKPDTEVLAALARYSRWKFPDVETLHALGTDGISLKIVKGGVLYPCQAMFLGQSMPLLTATAGGPKFSERMGGEKRMPPFVAIEKSGVLLHERMSSAERATLIGLAQVTQRTEEYAQLRYLNWEEVAQVLSEGVGGYKDMTEEANADGAATGKLSEECNVACDGNEYVS
jgi:rhamnose utilization protein RhaD (predicted bifunctional aldolase and dehydrogenase)